MNILHSIWIILYFVITLISINYIWTILRLLKIKINIHTLPIILLGILYILISWWLLMEQFIIFLRVGLILGMFAYLLSSIGSSKVINNSILGKAIIIMSTTLFWPLAGLLLGFQLSFMREINQLTK